MRQEKSVIRRYAKTLSGTGLQNSSAVSAVRMKTFRSLKNCAPGDSMLICTDGFWGSIHERQIEKTLKKSTSAQNWLDNMLKIVEKNIKHQKYSRFRDSFCAITIKL